MTDLSHWAAAGFRAGRPQLPLRFPKPRWRTSRALGWILPLLLLATWWGASEAHLVAEQILPRPENVARALGELAGNGDLKRNLLISLSRVAYGFAGGAMAGLLLGAGMGFSPSFARFVRPTFLAVSQIPILAWLPFFMLLLGIGEALKIVLVAKAVFTPVTLGTAAGIEGVPLRYLEVARVLQLSRWQTLRRVIWPAALPQIFTGFRYGLTHAWMALVMVELLASYEGVGYLMIYSRQLFQLDVMVAMMLVIALVGLFLDRLLALTERHLLRRYGAAS